MLKDHAAAPTFSATFSLKVAKIHELKSLKRGTAKVQDAQTIERRLPVSLRVSCERGCLHRE